MKNLLIAIDFDDTYTADPEGWRAVIDMMRARGHEFICVTARNDHGKMADEVLEEFKSKDGIYMSVVFAGFDLKRAAAEKLGYKVDIWIDDCPSMIDKQVFLL